MRGNIDIRDMECCAFKEISCLSYYDNPEEALFDLITYEYRGEFRLELTSFTCGAWFFSEANGGKYGTNFASFLTEEKLGTVTNIPEFINPNSTNEVRAFVVIFDKEKITSWWKKTLKTKTKTKTKKAS